MSQPQKAINIHFVCRGNTFRSRLAAAYFATVAPGNYIVSSSGIDVSQSPVKTSQKYTQHVGLQRGLTHQIRTPKVQTTNELLAAADIIVFMGTDIYSMAALTFQIDSRKIVVWHVNDVPPAMKAKAKITNGDLEIDKFAQKTYDRIRKLCYTLCNYLTSTSWVDIVDKHNCETGLRLPVAWANDRGLWHRGVHVVIRTSDGKYIVGKRAKTIVFAPGMLEISLGGAVDSGENPLSSAQRETYEELGIAINQRLFRPLFIHTQHSYHPHTMKLSRVHLYVYSATVPTDSVHFALQPEEVSDARIVSQQQIKHLLRKHRIKHFGQLKGGYKFYDKAIAYSTKEIAF